MDAIKAAEAIRKYKELLDMGAITAEEFEERKRQFLSSTGENGGESKPSPKSETKPADAASLDWRCGKCGAVNIGAVKCCKNCGGIQQIVGFELVGASSKALGANGARTSNGMNGGNASGPKRYTNIPGQQNRFVRQGVNGPQGPYNQQGQFNQQGRYGQQGPYNQMGPYGQMGMNGQQGPYGRGINGQNGMYNQMAPGGQQGMYNQMGPGGQQGPYNQMGPGGQQGPYKDRKSVV